MARMINTILNLQDRMSPKLLKVSNKVKDMDADTRRATQRMANMANKFSSSVNKMVTKSAKFAAIGTTMAGAFALKTGIGEAMNMEGFRTQLETATKSAKKAAEIMKWSVNLANSTPFETGSVIEMSSKFEAMGMSAKKWGGITADMAGATNKDIIQATEAIVDAQTGELERLKEFGIKKADIANKAAEMFKNQAVVNAKGQITDQDKFNQALMALMEEKYKGGAASLAKTAKGMWSTITGVTKTSLANIVGMQNDGVIKSGSLLDRLKQKIQQVADKLTEWQSDGTIAKIGDTFSRVFGFIYNVISKVYKLIKKYKSLIVVISTFAASLFLVTKALAALKIVLSGVNTVLMILDGTLKVLPFTRIILLISAVITIGVLLWKNWDKVKAKALELWTGIKSTFGGIRDSIAGAFSAAKEKVKGFFSWIWDKLKGLNKKIESIPVIGELYKGFKTVVKYTTPIGLAMDATKKMSKNAMGTQYFKGGITQINERGGEIVDLPNGSKVIPADKTNKLLGKGEGNIFNININGVGKSTNEIMAELMPALKLQLANM